MEYVVTFDSTNQAIKAERCLLERKLQVGVLPLPPQIRAGCGICLRVGQDGIRQALAALEDNAIDGIGLYARMSENGRPVYSEINPDNMNGGVNTHDYS
jgi:hypothetical protein